MRLFFLDLDVTRHAVDRGEAVVLGIQGQDFFGHGERRFGGDPGRGRIVNAAGAIAMGTDGLSGGEQLVNCAGQEFHRSLLLRVRGKSRVCGRNLCFLHKLSLLPFTMAKSHLHISGQHAQDSSLLR
jgi:hypothetical protein